MWRILTLVVVAAVAVIAGGWWYFHSSGPARPQFRLVQVERGPLIATIGATGTLEPEDIIDVGAQVSGRIDRFGLDPRYVLTQNLAYISAALPLPQAITNIALLSPTPPKTVDYNSPVEQGTILAQIDPTLFLTKVATARAELQQATADLGQMRAKFNQAQRDWERMQSLAGSKAVAPSDVDLARQTYESAGANIDAGRATIAQKQAALQEAEVNLGYTTIRSPVNGSIIDRRVNIGQTVAASLNTPSFFLIAKDLARLQIWAPVVEADIGRIESGQLVHFTVDAFPNKHFRGRVADDQPRLNAATTNNVVTYTVIVNVNNRKNPNAKDDAKNGAEAQDLFSKLGPLRPYMTANLQFVVKKIDDALLVPNAALRWKPKPAQVHPNYRTAFVKGPTQKRDTTGTGKPSPGESTERGTVWVPDGAYVRPINVKTGLSDGIATEIVEVYDGDEITPGTELVAGEARQDSGGAGGANPFVPSTFGGKKKE